MKPTSDEKLQPTPLRESAERMQLALEAARVVAWEFDVTTRTLQFAGNVDGVPRHSSAAGADPLRAFDAQRLEAELSEHAGRSSGTYTSEFQVVQPDGTSTWMRNEGRTVLD